MPNTIVLLIGSPTIESEKMSAKLGHVLIIPDGNRRWAKEHKHTYEEAYKIGAEEITPLITQFFLIEGRATELTFFAIARNNILKRDIGEEIMPILEVQKEMYKRFSRRPDFEAAGIRFRHIGDDELLPPDYLDALKELEETSKNRTGPRCNFLCAYDGEWELAKAFNNGMLKAGTTLNPDITPYLYLDSNIDLVIRSGFEHRLSSCPLVQMAHAELYFADFHYPEYTKEKLDEILEEYEQKERRYGR